MDQLWRALLNASRRLRSHLRQCDTNSPSAPTLPLFPVAPDLRRLSRQLNQRQPPRSPYLLRAGKIEGAHAWHDATPSRSAKDCGPRSPWIRCLRNPPEQPGRKRRGPSLATAGPPRKQPLLCLLPPRLALGGREKCVYGSSWAHYSTQVSDRCDSGQNKTHTFSKREQKSFSANHKHPALMQPVCTAVSTPCHTGRGLAGHPRCVNVGNDYGKTRLYTPIRSKTTALPWCAHHHIAQRERSSPPRRGDESAGKRSHTICSSSPERVRLLQPLLPRPEKKRQPVTYTRSQTPELSPCEKVVQDDHFETDPTANMPRGLVHDAGSKLHVVSYPPITDDF